MRIMALALLLVLAGCGKQLAEDRWLENQWARCHAMGGQGYYNVETKTFECFRHPIGRMAKQMFKETFQ